MKSFLKKLKRTEKKKKQRDNNQNNNDDENVNYGDDINEENTENRLEMMKKERQK